MTHTHREWKYYLSSPVILLLLGMCTMFIPITYYYVKAFYFFLSWVYGLAVLPRFKVALDDWTGTKFLGDYIQADDQKKKRLKATFQILDAIIVEIGLEVGNKEGCGVQKTRNIIFGSEYKGKKFNVNLYKKPFIGFKDVDAKD